MERFTESTARREGFHLPVWFRVCVFLAVATFFLWEEHRAHILGVLPYLPLLLCPIVHLFMHRGHSDDGAGHRHDATGRPI
jgi:hypothetical protein